MRACIRGMSARICDMATRIHWMAARIRGMSARIHEMAARIRRMGARIHEIDARIHAMDARIRRMATRSHEMPARIHDVTAPEPHLEEIVRGTRYRIAPSAIASVEGKRTKGAGRAPVGVLPAVVAFARLSGKEDIPTLTTKIQGKGNEAALAEQLIVGTQKHLSTVTQVIIDGSAYTAPQVEAKLQAFADLRTAVDTARAALKAKLVDEQAEGPGLRAFFVAFIQFVRAAFGSSPDVLLDFGLPPKKKRAPQSAEQKAAAAAKRAATRKARGIIGKRKRAEVHGNVTGVQVTPVTTASPPAPSPEQKAPNASDGQPPTGTPATK